MMIVIHFYFNDLNCHKFVPRVLISRYINPMHTRPPLPNSGSYNAWFSSLQSRCKIELCFNKHVQQSIEPQLFSLSNSLSSICSKAVSCNAQRYRYVNSLFSHWHGKTVALTQCVIKIKFCYNNTMPKDIFLIRGQKDMPVCSRSIEGTECIKDMRSQHTQRRVSIT